MKHLLAISWEMPPMYGPRATQVSRALAELAAIGWKPTVVCLAPRRGGPHWFDRARDVPPAGVELARVPSPQERFAVRALHRLMPSLRDRPDTARLWIPGAVREATRLAASGEWAGIITFAQPWSDHLVGLALHRRTKLPWVAHFSDPWVDSPYATGRQKSIWCPMEEEVVRHAAAVVFVTEEAADLVMRKYPADWRRKAAVVPHGFDWRTSKPPAPSVDGNRPMRMVYTGRFYSGIRTPATLLQAIADSNRREALAGRLEVLFIGPHVEEYRAEAERLGISSLTQFRGRVPADAAARAADDADVLLVVDAPSRGPNPFLPSKLIDYLPARRPIFGITPEPGASARLLRRLGCTVAPPDDVAAIGVAVDDLVAKWRSGTLTVGADFDAVAGEFDARVTARRLDDVLKRAFG